MTTPTPFTHRLLAGRYLRERPVPLEAQPDGERADAWRERIGVSEPLFEDRLARAALSTDDFVRLVGADAGADAAPEVPAWAERLAEVAARPDRVDAIPECFHEGGGAFAGLVRPFLQHGLSRLQAGRDELAPELAESLAAGLLEVLVRRSARTTLLEVHVARERGDLNDEADRAGQFAARLLSDPDRFRDLVGEYPVLGRLLLEGAEAWAEAAAEILDRAAADAPMLRDAFGSAAPLGPVLRVDATGGDAHGNGRAVAIVTFGSGVRVVYKPTSQAVTARYQDLLADLNRAGLTHSHRTLTVVDRGTYGWVEFADAAPCPPDALGRFYWRHGSHLALADVLRGTDLHLENVIAAGEHPVLVDLETLFHTDAAAEPARTGQQAVDRALRASVVRTGMLPHAFSSETVDETPAVDLSAIGGRAGQSFGENALDVVGEGDAMRVVRGEATTRAAQNRPAPAADRPSPGRYQGHIVAGFRETLRQLADLGEDAVFDRFVGVDVRQILRSTGYYGLLLQEGWHPDHLRDGLARDFLVDHVWARAGQEHALRRVADAEADALRRGDVPRFAARPEATSLWDATGREIEAFFDETPLDAARERFRALSERSVEWEVGLVRLAVPDADDRQPPVAPSTAEADPVRAAEAMGDRLCRMARHGGDEAGWAGVQYRSTGGDLRDAVPVLAPIGPSLYEGTAGVALFLAYAARETGRPDFRDLALRALRATRRAAASDAFDLVGPFSGRASYPYLLLHLAALWDRPDLLAEAERTLDGLGPRIGSDDVLDVVGGVAGTIPVLLALHEATSSDRALTLAVECGDRLLDTSQDVLGGRGWATAVSDRPSPGFSHGAAGIAWALSRLSVATGKARFAHAAAAAFRFDRAAATAAGEPWRSHAASWCHGPLSSAVGVATASEPVPDRGPVAVGARAALERGLRPDLCLCHGTLGNADALRTLAAETPDAPASWGAVASRLEATAAHAVLRRDWAEAAPGYADVPGLMCGVAGVGLGLLRAARPDRVPSVLTLDPPPVSS